MVYMTSVDKRNQSNSVGCPLFTGSSQSGIQCYHARLGHIDWIQCLVVKLPSKAL